MAENTNNVEKIVEATHNRSSSDDEDYPNKKCKHVKESVNVKAVKKKVSSLKASDIECVTCAKSSKDTSPLFTPTIAEDIPREESTSSKDAETLHKKVIQLCLACGELNCGRDDKEHAIRHFKEKDHAISLNLDTSEAWCYECDEFVVPSTKRNQVVAEAQAIVRKQFKESHDDEEEEERVSIFRKKGKNNSYQVTAPGLNNLGNTCFFNSVMQVVVGTSVLHDALIPADPYHDPPHIEVSKCVTATEEEVGPLTDAFKNFLREMWRTNDNTVSPRDLFSQISKKWQQFRGWRQQDSQELMRFLFDGVKSEELEHIKKLELQKPQKSQYMDTDDYHDDNDDSDDYDDDDDDDGDDGDNDDSVKEKKVIKKYESFIDACFGGNLVSVIVCDVCKHCSYSYEEFLDVSLPIKSSSKNSFGYSDYNNYGSSYGGSGSGFGYISNIGSGMFNDSNDSSTNDDESGNKGEDENRNEEESSDTEKEEGIPVPNKEERTRIKLLLRDLPSDSGRSTPNPSKDVTLMDCLKSFVKVETLEGDNSFACDNCWKLKKAYEERKNEINGVDDAGDTVTVDTGDTGDTGDTVDTVDTVDTGDSVDISDSDNIKDDKNQTNGLETEENSQEDSSASQMEGIEYNNDADNRRSEVEAGSSEVDNENSSDTSDGVQTAAKRDSNEFDNEDRILTTSESNEFKSALDPERPYIFRKAYKRYLFDSLPPVMVFHLKRFQQVGGRWSVSMRKIDDFVAFDEVLDVGDFVVPPEIEKDEENGINNGHIIDGNTESSFKQNKQRKLSKLSTKYRLYGVVVHLGSLYNGHYIAYVLSRNIRGEGEQFGISEYLHGDKIREFERQRHKTDDQRQWIYCSDSSVRSATVDEVLNSGAYLLFYERVHE